MADSSSVSAASTIQRLRKLSYLLWLCVQPRSCSSLIATQSSVSISRWSTDARIPDYDTYNNVRPNRLAWQTNNPIPMLHNQIGVRRRRKRSGTTLFYMISSPTIPSLDDTILSSTEDATTTAASKTKRPLKYRSSSLVTPLNPQVYTRSTSSSRILDETQAKYNLQMLQQELKAIAVVDPSLWTEQEVDAIMASIDDAATAAIKRTVPVDFVDCIKEAKSNLDVVTIGNSEETCMEIRSRINKLRSGAAEFLLLLIDVTAEKQQETARKACMDTTEKIILNDNQETSSFGKDNFSVLTKETLIAAAFHYCDSTVAQEEVTNNDNVIDTCVGQYPSDGTTRTAHLYTSEIPFSPIKSTSSLEPLSAVSKHSHHDEKAMFAIVPSSHRAQGRRREIEDTIIDVKGVVSTKKSKGGQRSRSEKISTYPLVSTVTTTATDLPPTTATTSASEQQSHSCIQQEDATTTTASTETIEASYGADTGQIYSSAGQIQRVEKVATEVLSRRQSSSMVSPSQSDAATLRGLLVSMTDDWRGLAIRSVACLYRLQAIVRYQASSSHFVHGSTPQSLSLSAPRESDAFLQEQNFKRMAREALYVYAPLSQRLGMHKLKSEIEHISFRILFNRQYQAAMTLYARSGFATVESIMTQVTSEIRQAVKNDDWLASRVDHLTVAARIKQPYSFWRKLLRKRYKQREKATGSNSAVSFDSSGSASQNPSRQSVSISDINDVVAVRVVLRSKSASSASAAMSDHEKEFYKREEELLCYYVQRMIMNLWPTSNERIKDYISEPKANGYQSLHHTVRIQRYGQVWPFEVQVRTEGMHARSEFGVAAHWDYKLKNGKQLSPKKSSATLPAARSSLRRNHRFLPSKSKRKAPTATSTTTSATTTTTTLEVAPSCISEQGHCSAVKEGTDSEMEDSSVVQSSSSSSSIQSNTNSVQSYADALVVAREHLKQNSVYVFVILSPTSSATTSLSLDGKLIALESQSTVLDAIMAVNLRLHWGCNLDEISTTSEWQENDDEDDESCCPLVIPPTGKILLNNVETDWNTRLSNGDVLSLPVRTNTEKALGNRNFSNYLLSPSKEQ